MYGKANISCNTVYMEYKEVNRVLGKYIRTNAVWSSKHLNLNGFFSKAWNELNVMNVAVFEDCELKSTAPAHMGGNSWQAHLTIQSFYKLKTAKLTIFWTKDNPVLLIPFVTAMEA